MTSAQPKGYLYDEQKVRSYTLPNPLVCVDGSAEKIQGLEPKRRPEILRLFENSVGRAPENLNTWNFWKLKDDRVERYGETQTNRN